MPTAGDVDFQEFGWRQSTKVFGCDTLSVRNRGKCRSLHLFYKRNNVIIGVG